MRLYRALSTLALIAALPGVAPVAADGPVLSAEEILSQYVADFRLDPAAGGPIIFGVSISGEGGGEWHVAVAEKEEGREETTVELRRRS